MVDQTRHQNTRVDTVQRDEWRLTVVDLPSMRDAAIDREVVVLDTGAFARPVLRVRMSVGPGGVVEAAVRAGADVPHGRSRFAVIGNDPLGLLLTRRAETGDQVAIRVRDGLETVVGQVYRRFGFPAPTAPVDRTWEHREVRSSTELTDVETGLTLTVTSHAVPGDAGELVHLRAAVPQDALSAAHLAAVYGAVVTVARQLSPDAPVPANVELRVIPVGDSAERPVTLDQVGGLDAVVAQFREVALSFAHPEAMARWGAQRPQGILLYGPAGTGKTMLARALAHEIGGTLRQIRTTEILDKWLGASERNMKRIFQEARRYRQPTVLLFDEFDSIISYAGAGDDSGSQAVNAVAGIFKQEMNDLIAQNPNVIVVATTNFPDLIDASLIRSGRFDIKLEIPAPDEHGRAQILAHMIRDLTAEHAADGFQMFAADLDLADLGRHSAGMTGADLREVLRRTQMAKAMDEARTGRRPDPISNDDLRRTITQLGSGTS
ncbi:ATP-binding protein [Luedemannella helvata]|uniref:AAA+ ATPase domain-containing protein n=1 Tax=Luedemannella helvata TaxID=349315 RepID=A0ABP4X0G2_9ACTN